MKNRILIIGPYPSPLGGISVHIRRLAMFLNQEGFNHFDIFDDSRSVTDKSTPEINVINEKKLIFYLKLLVFCNYEVIHYHSVSWKVRFLLTLTSKIHGAKLIFTFHSLRLTDSKFKIIDDFIIKYVIKNMDYCIAVSEEVKSTLLKIGANAKTIELIPAFIDPIIEDSIEFEIPKDILAFLKSNDKNILVNASGIRFFEGIDLFGLDITVDLLNNLVNDNHIDVGIVFLIPQIENESYLEHIKNTVLKYGLHSKILFIHRSIPMYHLFKYVDLFLRPTSSDGDAISIREGLSFNVRVLASDVCLRPLGTNIFYSRDLNSLTNETIKLLTLDEKPIITSEVERYKFAEQILNLYISLIEEGSVNES